jgi:hypothetical protein
MGRWSTVLAFVGGLVVALLLVLIVVLLNDDQDPAAGATSSTTVPAVTSEATTTTTTVAVSSTATTVSPGTTVPTSSTAAASSTITTVPGGRCDSMESMSLPAGVEIVGGNGVFDGSPEPESVMDTDLGFVFEGASGWQVGFSLHSGYVVFAPLPEPGMDGFVPSVRVWNFEGDDGLVVHADRSLMSGADVYLVYFLGEECEVELAGTIDDGPLELLDWFGANHTQAFTCVENGIYVTMASETSSGSWDVRSRFFEWIAPVAPGFEFGFEDGMEVPPGDPSVDAAGIVDC